MDIVHLHVNHLVGHLTSYVVGHLVDHLVDLHAIWYTHTSNDDHHTSVCVIWGKKRNERTNKAILGVGYCVDIFLFFLPRKECTSTWCTHEAQNLDEY